MKNFAATFHVPTYRALSNIKQLGPFTERELYLELVMTDKGDSLTVADVASIAAVEFNKAQIFFDKIINSFKELEPDSGGSENSSSVSITEKEKESLLKDLSPEEIDFWVKSLNDYALMKPTAFRKYKNHAAVIRTWHRIETGKGKVWCKNFPGGAGYYPEYMTRQYMNAPLVVEETDKQLGIFPK